MKMEVPQTTSRETSGLERIVIGLELVAGAIVAGAFLAKGFRSFFGTDEALPNPAQVEVKTPVLAEEVRTTGYNLLNRANSAEQSIHDLIRQKYHGLWLIGRVGGRIESGKLDPLASELGHFHKQSYDVTGHDTDRALVAWYETVGVSKRLPLAKILRQSPIVDQAFSAALYAASAITGDKDPSLTYELQTEEWNNIKRHLGL